MIFETSVSLYTQSTRHNVCVCVHEVTLFVSDKRMFSFGIRYSRALLMKVRVF